MLLLAASLAACDATPSATTPCGVAGARPRTRYDHVVWIVFENKTHDEVIGNAAAPYLSNLAARCATATDFADAGSQYPSLPNYMAATSGVEPSTLGITTDCHASVPPSTACATTVNNVFHQLRAAARPRRLYAGAMPSNCAVGSSGTYTDHHNPYVHYRGNGDWNDCLANNVPLGSPSSGHFASDLDANTLPALSIVVPNNCNSMHDCSVATGDKWASRMLPRILDSSTYKAGRTAVFVVWDEDTPIPNIVVSPSTPPGKVVTKHLDLYDLLRTTEDKLGLPCLGIACFRNGLTQFNL
jgi:phospholipase C